MRDSNTAIGRSRRNRDREVVPQTPDSKQGDEEDQNADTEQDTENDELVPAVVPIENDE